MVGLISIRKYEVAVNQSFKNLDRISTKKQWPSESKFWWIVKTFLPNLERETFSNILLIWFRTLSFMLRMSCYAKNNSSPAPNQNSRRADWKCKHLNYRKSSNKPPFLVLIVCKNSDEDLKFLDTNLINKNLIFLD